MNRSIEYVEIDIEFNEKVLERIEELIETTEYSSKDEVIETAVKKLLKTIENQN
ncbi:ribbon-helix-helix protein, CopG family [Methanonatronarchaeum sp. AMET-Sl]|uniref:ribbon-helix-helix protein, CopG family n=1 Tax=Methanonatronarchaeum sp. AMET-Sl TaxID=3037654 RepID=UPI00244DAFF8|nr:ribbon-helix-helix protein, CopG family [Methanonatronarchaeum sp. AMET-Sl]WGI18101.1 ribbon-helix-helix protein, CopG family [Methanonatronarchaeum sp. AMET-Sl]